MRISLADEKGTSAVAVNEITCDERVSRGRCFTWYFRNQFKEPIPSVKGTYAGKFVLQLQMSTFAK